MAASWRVEVTAPPVPRLFPRTPYGTSVWACVLFERYACLRPLHRVSTWMSDQGLPISVGTLADSVPRFLPLFEPFDEAILSHQNEAAVRHGDETSWRIQSLRETGRSSRAWLWTSVSHDAVYFHIDPSRSAKVAHQLFGAAACILFLVCDRLSTYKTMARELGGAVILCWCWAHRVARQMGVARRRLDIAVAEHLPDYRQGLAERQGPGREAVSEIVESDVDQPGLVAHEVPNGINAAAACAGPAARKHLGTVRLARQSF